MRSEFGTDSLNQSMNHPSLCPTSRLVEVMWRCGECLLGTLCSHLSQSIMAWRTSSSVLFSHFQCSSVVFNDLQWPLVPQWSFMIFYDFQCLLVFLSVLQLFSVFLSNLQWFSLVLMALWRPSMIFSGPQWSSVVFSGLQWSSGIFSNIQCFSVLFSHFQCFSMFFSGPQGSSVIFNDPQWSLVVFNKLQ